MGTLAYHKGLTTTRRLDDFVSTIQNVDWQNCNFFITAAGHVLGDLRKVKFSAFDKIGLIFFFGVSVF
jgi:hypothetical protein